MTEKGSLLKGIRILAVDDEEDILETIQEILDEAQIDTARDYKSASHKIRQGQYDLAILDIMGVDGLKLLEETVDRGIPTVMLTAHAISPETLMASATSALEIQVLEPFNSQWSPLSSAFDLMAMTSEPASGSVMAKAPTYSAVTRLGIYFSLSSSLP